MHIVEYYSLTERSRGTDTCCSETEPGRGMQLRSLGQRPRVHESTYMKRLGQNPQMIVKVTLLKVKGFFPPPGGEKILS